MVYLFLQWNSIGKYVQIKFEMNLKWNKIGNGNEIKNNMKLKWNKMKLN